jgi:glycosyltransferase involved in cell wall biosynthesis
VHNGPIYRAPDGSFYGSHFTETVKARYLQLGDHLTYLGRVVDVEKPSTSFSFLTADNFGVVEVPDVLTPIRRVTNHFKAHKIIKTAVASVDVVVARLPSLISRIAVGYAIKFGKPYLSECVACNWDALSNHKLLWRLSAPWYYYAQKRVIKDAPHVIYVTNQFLQRRYPTNGQQYSISDVEIAPSNPEILLDRIENISELIEKPRTIRLVTVASVSTPYKGQDDVIHAMSLLLGSGLNFEYHLIGGGDQHRLRTLALAKNIENRVYFHGSVTHDSVFSLLDDMDIYVQPSRQEGLPRALIEAMSRGLPAIGARTGGIPELLPAERIYAPKDIAQLRALLTNLVNYQELKKDAQRNFDKAQKYTTAVLSEKRKSAYRNFLDSVSTYGPK